VRPRGPGMRRAAGRWTAIVSLLVAPLVAAPLRAETAGLADLARAGDWQKIKAFGPSVLPELVAVYKASDVKGRASVAYVLYNLGWKSPDAKRALMADVHTSDSALRLQVQWALGRVSDDSDVVDILLDNMRHDAVPLFRDKAACALAYDQIHLAPAQRARLFEGLIAALDDAEPQVRHIALQALAILTGQTKGYNAAAAPDARAKAVAAWRLWLAEFKANL
jgi:HEAT repeat protein